MTIMTRTVARLLLAPLLVLALGVLVKGYTNVGDGFTAGILVAVGLLMEGLVFGERRAQRLLPVRWAYRLALGGVLLGLAIAIAPLFAGDPLFTHYPLPGDKPVTLGTLELITAVLFDLAVFLLVLGTLVAAVHLVAGAEEERS